MYVCMSLCLHVRTLVTGTENAKKYARMSLLVFPCSICAPGPQSMHAGNWGTLKAENGFCVGFATLRLRQQALHQGIFWSDQLVMMRRLT